MAKKKVIDEARVAELAFNGASNREIAAILDCDHTTISNRFSPLLDKKRAERRAGLRKAQTDAALGGDRTMLVWLGKQELSQSDKLKHDMSNLTDEQIIALYRAKRHPGRAGAKGVTPPR